jgi:uncharacterized protein RhaS with RHS repeats
VGLINARGRVYDPKVGRFLTTDPIVADLYFGQTLNPYSYVIGNPLTLVDPSGFQHAFMAESHHRYGGSGIRSHAGGMAPERREQERHFPKQYDTGTG